MILPKYILLSVLIIHHLVGKSKFFFHFTQHIENAVFRAIVRLYALERCFSPICAFLIKKQVSKRVSRRDIVAQSPTRYEAEKEPRGPVPHGSFLVPVFVRALYRKSNV